MAQIVLARNRDLLSRLERHVEIALLHKPRVV